MKDLPQPRQAHVMMRGQYDKPGEPVARRVPRFLPPLENCDGSDAARPREVARGG